MERTRSGTGSEEGEYQSGFRKSKAGDELKGTRAVVL